MTKLYFYILIGSYQSGDQKIGRYFYPIGSNASSLFFIFLSEAKTFSMTDFFTHTRFEVCAWYFAWLTKLLFMHIL